MGREISQKTALELLEAAETMDARLQTMFTAARRVAEHGNRTPLNFMREWLRDWSSDANFILHTAITRANSELQLGKERRHELSRTPAGAREIV